MSEAKKVEFPSIDPMMSQDGRSPEESKQALDDLFSLVYEELRRLASLVRRNEVNATMSSTALLHEAWMRLRDSPPLASTSLAHFKPIAARAMRQVLVDEARRRSARKRGGAGEILFVGFDEAVGEIATGDHDLLALDASIHELATHSPRQARMVECRFFGGLSVTETAAILGVSESAIERDWRAAKAWLGNRIHPGKHPATPE
jgi:RNA polymerase sigma factor (TIGR02999 family)